MFSVRVATEGPKVMCHLNKNNESLVIIDFK